MVQWKRVFCHGLNRWLSVIHPRYPLTGRAELASDGGETIFPISSVTEERCRQPDAGLRIE